MMQKENAMTPKEMADMMDISAVQAENTLQDIDACCELAAEFGGAAVFCLPAHVPYLRKRLDSMSLKISVASVAGFPGGSETPRIKAATARELVELGCDEVDMVNNITWLKAGDRSAYVDDVAGVVAAAGGKPVKVIIECHWLSEEEIIRACEWCVEAGAAWVKTGTGWTPTGATVERVALMAKTVAGRCQVKAAGGVRTREMLQALYDAGARRFGVGVKSARAILTQ